MERKDFIEELAFLLQDIDDLERGEALQYYEDYFDEAGKENEQQVIADLGSPEKVAAVIKAGLKNQFDQDIEFSENGMDNANYKETKELVERKQPQSYHQEKVKKHHFEGNPDRNKILLIIIIVGIVVLGLPVGGGILGVTGGLIAGIFGLIVGVFAGSIGCFAGAVACFVKGIMTIGYFPGGSLIILGIGFLLIALAILFIWLAKGLLKVIPVVARGIMNFARSIIRKVGELI